MEPLVDVRPVVKVDDELGVELELWRQLCQEVFDAAAAQGEEALFRGSVEAAADDLVQHGVLGSFPAVILLRQPPSTNSKTLVIEEY